MTPPQELTTEFFLSLFFNCGNLFVLYLKGEWNFGQKRGPFVLCCCCNRCLNLFPLLFCFFHLNPRDVSFLCLNSRSLNLETECEWERLGIWTQLWIWESAGVSDCVVWCSSSTTMMMMAGISGWIECVEFERVRGDEDEVDEKIFSTFRDALIINFSVKKFMTCNWTARGNEWWKRRKEWGGEGKEWEGREKGKTQTLNHQ